MSKKDILIIEDDRSIVRILELELKYEGYSFDSAHDGKEGLEKFNKNEYALILLDLMLPEINGMEVCRKIRRTSLVPIIMLTARRDVTDKVIGLDLGADDYITKPFESEELLARIRAGLRHSQQRLNGSKTIKVLDLTLNQLTREVLKQETPIDLTKKEYELLEYLMLHNGQVLAREQILERVWGYDFEGDTNVLDVYIRYLRNKIDHPYGSKLIHTIRGVGYVLKE